MMERKSSNEQRPNYLMTSMERERNITVRASEPKGIKQSVQVSYGLSYEQPTYFFTKHTLYNEKSYKSPFYEYEPSPEKEKIVSSRSLDPGRSIRNFQEFKINESSDEMSKKMSILKLDPLVVNNYITWDKKQIDRSELYYAEKSLCNQKFAERLKEKNQFKKLLGEISFYEAQKIVKKNVSVNESSILKNSRNIGSPLSSSSKLDLHRSNLSERPKLPSLNQNNSSIISSNKSCNTRRWERESNSTSSKKFLNVNEVREELNRIHNGKLQKIRMKAGNLKEMSDITNKNIIYNQIMDRLQNKRAQYVNEKLEQSFNEEDEDRRDFEGRVKFFNQKNRRRDLEKGVRKREDLKKKGSGNPD